MKTLTTKFEEFLQSSGALIMCLGLVLAFSIPNNIEVISKLNRIPYINPIESRILALCLAVVIELVILVLASIGQTAAAKYYAWCSFVLHLIYYHRWRELLISDYSNIDTTQEVITDFIASILLAAIVSRSIYYFSEQIKIKMDEKKRLKQDEDRAHCLTEEIIKLETKKQELYTELDRLLDNLAENRNLSFVLEGKVTRANNTIAEQELALKDLEAKTEELKEQSERYTAAIISAKQAKNRLGVRASDEVKNILQVIQ